MFAREIPDKETALSAILEELEKRYGEKFHQTHETQVVEKAYPEKGEKKYDFLLNPSTVQYIATLAQIHLLKKSFLEVLILTLIRTNNGATSSTITNNISLIQLFVLHLESIYSRAHTLTGIV